MIIQDTIYTAPTICPRCSAQFCMDYLSPTDVNSPIQKKSKDIQHTAAKTQESRPPAWGSFHYSSLSSEDSQKAQWDELGCPWEVRTTGGGDEKRVEKTKADAGETLELLQRKTFIKDSELRDRQRLYSERGAQEH